MKKIFLTIALFASSLALSAQALPSLLIPESAKSLSLAGSDVALPVYTQKAGINVSYKSWAPNTVSSTYFGTDAYFKMGSRFALTLDGRLLSGEPMDILSEVGVPKKTFTPTELLVGAGAYVSITDALSLDVKGKFAKSTIYEKVSGSAIIADVTLRYNTPSLSAAVGLDNFGTKINYGSKDYSLPAVVRAGAAYGIIDGLTAMAEADYLLSGSFMAGLGVEYKVIEMVAVRAGYHYGDKAAALPSFVSAGIGLSFEGLSINATVLFGSDILTGTAGVSLGYSF